MSTREVRENKNWVNKYSINKKTFHLTVKSKKDPNRCYSYTISLRDLEKVKQHMWSCKSDGSHVHAPGRIYLTHIILGVASTEKAYIKHVDGNIFNLRRTNLKDTRVKQLPIMRVKSNKAPKYQVPTNVPKVELCQVPTNAPKEREEYKIQIDWRGIRKEEISHDWGEVQRILNGFKDLKFKNIQLTIL